MDSMLNENFESLKQLFAECLNSKNNLQDTELNLDENIKAASLTFVLIKQVNRLVKYKVRSGRQELQAKKSVVDCNRLQLHNLFYELNYLQREIKQCYQFKSQDEDIEIYEGSEQKAFVNTQLTHRERITRLEREWNLRKQLSGARDKLLKDKDKLLQDIVHMKNPSTFAPSLKILLRATRPLQEALQLPNEQKLKMDHKVHMLPQHLYLTFVNLLSIELLEDVIDLSVEGQEDEVKEFELKIRQEPKDQSLLFKPHPLSLQIKIKHEDFPKDFVAVKLYFLPVLMIATAYCEIFKNDNNVDVIQTNLMQDCLGHIFEGDKGDDVPYSECSLILQRQNVTLEEFQKHMHNNKLGKPYLWTQKISGNSTFTNIHSSGMETQQLKDFTLEIVKRIRSSMHSRLVQITHSNIRI